MATSTVSQIPAQDKPALMLKAYPLGQVFEKLTDWRKQKGKVYQLSALFKLLLFGLMAGKRGPTSIVRWFRKLPFEVRIRLRFPLGRCPAPVTLCRLLQDVAVAELERQLQRWLRTINPQLAAAGTGQRLALDGKTLRGAANRGAKAAHLLAANRGHWGIENRLHWVRDVTFGEDHCLVWKKSAPQAFAALRNVLLALWRFLGHTNMAAAIDLYSAQPGVALDTLGATTGK